MVNKGADKVFLADLNENLLNKTTEEIGAIPIVCDVSNEESVKALVDEVTLQTKVIDIFMSNAGIYVEGDENTLNQEWMKTGLFT